MFKRLNQPVHPQRYGAFIAAAAVALALIAELGAVGLLLAAALFGALFAHRRGLLPLLLRRRLHDASSVEWVEATSEWHQAAAIPMDPIRISDTAKRFGKLVPARIGDLVTFQAPHALTDRRVVAILLRLVQRERGVVEAIYRETRPAEIDAYRLLVEMLRDRLRVSERAVLVGIAYLAEEVAYKRVRDAIAAHNPAVLTEVIECVVTSDLTRGTRTLDRYIERTAHELSIPGPMPIAWASAYEAELDRRRRSAFENQFKRPDATGPIGEIDDHVRRETWDDLLRQSAAVGLSIAVDDYLVVGIDHSRDSPVDRRYKRELAIPLATAFDNRCAKCGNGLAQLEFDHFWLPKSQGGNFAMRHRGRVYVNNCIPLCRSCNASKGARSFLEFFNGAEVERALRASQSLNVTVNAAFAGFSDDGWRLG